MTQTLLFAAIASAALVLGAFAGMLWKPPDPVLAALLAFSGGALTAALAFELFEESFAHGGLLTSSLGLIAGAAVFIVIDVLLHRHVRGEKARDAAGLALLAAVVLDGVPENLALGTTLAAGGGSVALLAAIFASNFPEAMVGTRSMTEGGRSKTFALVTWCAGAVLLAAAVVAGGSLLTDVNESALSVVLAFAGGAVLASLANTVFPKAYADGGPWVAFATVGGFLVAFTLGSVGP
ncbi:MAG TPA: zinc permease [Micromonosporaceae bacterium]|nr:zinc permease [Micromonosporaceae bacterium]HCU49920.1 zinc permease [Micromonosporaceae bacterium]